MAISPESVFLKDYSTFRIGGIAHDFYHIHTKSDLIEAFHNVQDPFILGGGSNILFPDEEFNRPIFYIQNEDIEMHQSGTFEIGAGASNAKIYQETKKQDYDFSLFSTIPGSIGGAVFGNAGLPEKEIKDIFIKAEVFDTTKNEFLIVDQTFFNFSYRHSALHETPHRYIIWKVWIQLEKKERKDIQEKAKMYLDNRKAKQPWGLTGGSFFKNPKNNAAGYLLDQVGAKQMSQGGAHFSQKHANFMMNDGSATQADIIALAQSAAQKVLKKYHIALTPEVRILDPDGHVKPFIL